MSKHDDPEGPVGPDRLTFEEIENQLKAARRSESDAARLAESSPNYIVRMVARDWAREHARRREAIAQATERFDAAMERAAVLARAIVAANRTAALSGITFRHTGRRSHRSAARRVLKATGTDDAGPEPPPAPDPAGLIHSHNSVSIAPRVSRG